VILYEKTRKEIGALGERVAVLYLSRHGQSKVEMNVARKTGEIDVITRTRDTLHFVEVKTFAVERLPRSARTTDDYDPSGNIHEAKIRKIARTAEWYVAENGWEGEWQIDAVLVWLRKRDGAAFVRYLPQIL
jgi:putative endonuclease